MLSNSKSLSKSSPNTTMVSNNKSLSKSNPNTTMDNKPLNLKHSTKLNSSTTTLVYNNSKWFFSRQQCHSFLAQFNSKLDNTSYNNKSKAVWIISPIHLVCYLQQLLLTTLLSCDPLTSTEGAKEILLSQNSYCFYVFFHTILIIFFNIFMHIWSLIIWSKYLFLWHEIKILPTFLKEITEKRKEKKRETPQYAE